MDRRIRVFPIAGLLVGVVLLAAFSIGLFSIQSEPPTFEWGVETGDTLTFNVTVYSSGADTIPWYDVLNHTIFRFNVSTLPAVDEITTLTQITDLVETAKLTLFPPVRYENGSEATSSAIDLVHSTVSKSILPVNGWSFIESIYTDLSQPSDCGFSCDHYYSRSFNGSFIFGHIFFNIDAGNGWYAHMNTATGLPSEIVWWHDDYILHRHYEFVITLASIE